MNRKKGYTVLEILYVLGIVGILSSIAILHYPAHRDKAGDAVSREDLRQAYSSANLYFADNPNGNLTMAALAACGFRPSPNVDVKIIHGRLADLLLMASYNAPGSRIHTTVPAETSPADPPDSQTETVRPESRTGEGGEAGRNVPSARSTALAECNRETERALKDAFATAQSYFDGNPGASVTMDILLAHGFFPNENLSLTVVNGERSELSMSAVFNFPEATNFTLDSSGRIAGAQ